MVTTHVVPTELPVPTSVDPTGIVHMPGSEQYDGGDRTYAVRHWLTRDPLNPLQAGIGPDGYTLRSGTEAQPSEILFRSPADALGHKYGHERCCNIGAFGTLAARTDTAGRTWPAITKHGWKYVRFGNTDDADPATFVQADDTGYDNGIRDQLVGDTIAGPGTTVHLDTPLGPAGVARIRAGLADGDPTTKATIQGVSTAGTKDLFNGGSGYNNRGLIVAISDNGADVTLAATSVTKETLDGASITIYLGALNGDRQFMPMFFIASPGAWPVAGTLTERACMNRELIFDGHRLEGANFTNMVSEESVGDPQEAWHAYSIRGTDGIIIRNHYLQGIWGDFFHTTGANQSGLTADDDVTLPVEDLLIANGVHVGCGRHAVTVQGLVNGLITDSVFRDIGRLFWDTEPTGAGARMGKVRVHNSWTDSGTVFLHMSGLSIIGEPAREVDGIVTAAGSDLITVPNDMVDSDDVLSGIAGTGIPTGAYLLARLSPTQFRMSANAEASGTITLEIDHGISVRDLEFDHVDCAGPPTYVGNIQIPAQKVYLEADVVADDLGDPQLLNIVFDDRVDGNVFTAADLVDASGTGPSRIPGSTIFPVGANQFAPVAGKYFVAAHTADSATIEQQTITAGNVVNHIPVAAVATIVPKDIPACTVRANERTLTTTTADSFLPSDKGKLVTGAGIRPGTRISSTPSKKSATLSLPASADATGTVTIAGRARFFTTSLVPSRWPGLTMRHMRTTGPGKWGGSSIVESMPDQPAIMVIDGQDEILIEKNYGVAARNSLNEIVRRMVGYFTYPNARGFGARPGTTTTIQLNRWIDALDNQMPDPTVVPILTDFVADDLTDPMPTFTVHVERSDGDPNGELRGHSVQFKRYGPGSTTGSTRAVGIIDDDGNATARAWYPSTPGLWEWRAVETPSYDMLEGVSDVLIQNVGDTDQTATETTLDVDPPSPTEEGTTITLTAVVAPDPGPGQVRYRDGLDILATVDLVAGTATFDVELAAGEHSLTASFIGNTLYSGSTSDPTDYTSTPIDVGDSTPPVVVATAPYDGATNITVDNPPIGIFFDETVTDVVAALYQGDTLVPSTLESLADGTIWLLSPEPELGRLEAGLTYTIAVTDAINEAGLHLAGAVFASFTTHSIPDEYIPTGRLVAIGFD